MKISFDNVSKHFFKQENRTLKELIPSLLKGMRPGEFIEALKDINLKFNDGDIVGVLGKNGAGKSTLLKLIAGVTQPTSGKILINGKIAPLIELGAGFHPQLTGQENIYLNGSIFGLSKKQIDAVYNDIVKFAELEKFINTPVKHYSSGMYMRLGFSVAVHVPFDILLTDEILAVGDIDYQQKCIKKMLSFKKQKKVIVFVSHHLETVGSFCNKGLVLDKGNQYFYGNVKEAIEKYKELL
jgi:ABC-type polysaccharide/polyol phosphate transport system ATPase subunit